jgi:putative nucleotidyltransferase with HDIG domain
MSMSASAVSEVPAEILNGLKDLEPLPITAQRLLEIASGQDVALTKVAELIELDPVITAAVLRQASTVRFAGAGTQSVRDAVLRMGTIALLDLVLEGYLKKLKVSTPMYQLSEDELWLHCAASKLAIRALATERPQLKLPPMAETAALLHDVGKLLITRCLKADVKDLLRHARDKGVTFVQAERDLIGVDHAVVGAAMCEAWKLPPEVTDAIRRHHSPPFTESTPVLDAVCLANVVVKTIEVGLGAEGLNFVVDPLCYRRLGVDFPTFGRVCLQTESLVRETKQLHGIS